jgi:L-fucose mutarotase/ribose pyranase (RbsD/FucU family)
VTVVRVAVRAVVGWDAPEAATVVDAHVKVRLPVEAVMVTAAAMVLPSAAAVTVIAAGGPEAPMVIAAAMAVVMVDSAVPWVLAPMVLIVAPAVVRVVRVALDSVLRSAAGKTCAVYRF